MSNKEKGFQLFPFPSSRIATFDVGRIGRDKHHITGLLEVDVTRGRKNLRQWRKDGRQVSFTAWFISSLAKSLEKHPEAHGMLLNKRNVIAFADVNIALPVERLVQGKAVPLVLLLKKVNHKSLEEITQEIRSAQSQELQDEGDNVLGARQNPWSMRLFYALPQGLRMLIWKHLLKDPHRRQRMMGSVAVTSLGVGAHFPGWIIPKSMHNLACGLGSIIKKPWVVGSEIQVREILHLTMLFDHDVIDGSPAARMIQDFVARLEKGVDFEPEVP
jgi:hypothetical protein